MSSPTHVLLDLARSLELDVREGADEASVEASVEASIEATTSFGDVTLRRGTRGAIELRVALDDLPAKFELLPQTRRVARGKDLRVGLAALDDAFVIRGDNPAAVIRLLRTNEVATALLEARGAVSGAVTLSDDTLSFTLAPEDDLTALRLRAKTCLSAAEKLGAAATEHEIAERVRRRELGHPHVKPLAYESKGPDASPPRERHPAAEWQRTERLRQLLGVFVAIPFGLLSAFAAYKDSRNGMIAVILIGGVLLAAIEMTIRKCPACGHRPFKGRLDDYRGAKLCPGCGVRLE